MQVWLRLLIVWFIAIALPVQGMAAATMAHCRQSHEPMGAAMATLQHLHADHDAGGAHHHDADVTGDADQADPALAVGADEPPGKVSDPGHQCSSCSSCCAGTALLNVTPRVPESAHAPAVFTEEMVTVDAFTSDGPDRPPRIHLV